MYKRQGEVGLLKAIGYKDRQVFFWFYLEHVKIALRAFVLGALLSGAAVLCINWINGSGQMCIRDRVRCEIHGLNPWAAFETVQLE